MEFDHDQAKRGIEAQVRIGVGLDWLRCRRGWCITTAFARCGDITDGLQGPHGLYRHRI